jgi:hypothetical protein
MNSRMRTQLVMMLIGAATLGCASTQARPDLLEIDANRFDEYWVYRGSNEKSQSTLATPKDGFVCASADVVVGSDGSVSSVRVHRVSPDTRRARKAAHRYFSQWRYEPGPANPQRRPVRHRLSMIKTLEIEGEGHAEVLGGEECLRIRD